MLHSFFFNHKMETLLDCIRWQRFLWLRKKLSFELQKRAPALKVLPLWCDLELLKVSLAEERSCCFFVSCENPFPCHARFRFWVLLLPAVLTDLGGLEYHRMSPVEHLKC